MGIGSGALPFKNGKMNTSIFADFPEQGMVGEGILLSMFQYEPAILNKYSGIQYLFRK